MAIWAGYGRTGKPRSSIERQARESGERHGGHAPGGVDCGIAVRVARGRRGSPGRNRAVADAGARPEGSVRTGGASRTPGGARDVRNLVHPGKGTDCSMRSIRSAESQPSGNRSVDVRRQAARAGQPGQHLSDQRAGADRQFHPDRPRRPAHQRSFVHPEARQGALRIRSAEPDRHHRGRHPGGGARSQAGDPGSLPAVADAAALPARRPHRPVAGHQRGRGHGRRHLT